MYTNLLFDNLTTDEVHHNGELIGKFSTPANNAYSVWIMKKEDGEEILVLIHEDDKEVAGIIEARTGSILYLHPRSIDGAIRLWNI